MPRRVALALTLLAALAVGSRAADAQPSGPVPRVGFLYLGSARTGLGAERYAAFLEGMRVRGYVEGKSVIVEARFADAKVERVPPLIQEVLQRKVDVIVPFYINVKTARALGLTVPPPLLLQANRVVG